MTRLVHEFRRLYAPATHDDAGDARLVGPQGQVRALVMELTGPPAWGELSKVWQGVQAELGFPAPAIAVSGVDGLQLWFSLIDAVTARQAQAFLDALRRRFLPGVAPRRWRLLPTADARHAEPVPALQSDGVNWSAFVAPDLAPVFGDAPWLDIPPGDEGQAGLLAGLVPVPRPVFEAAMALLAPDATPSVASDADAPTDAGMAAPAPMPHPPTDDPRRFLLQAMNDERVPMALRIEAAKALLAHTGSRPG